MPKIRVLRSLESFPLGRQLVNVLDAEDTNPGLPEGVRQLFAKSLVVQSGGASLAAGLLSQLVNACEESFSQRALSIVVIRSRQVFDEVERPHEVLATAV